MNLQELNPYLRRCWYDIIPANRNIKPRIILDYELICLESGKMLLEYNGTSFYCQQGDILLLCPGIPHSFQLLGEPLSQPHIHFDLVYDSYSPAVFVSMQPYETMTETARRMIRKNEFPHLANSPFLSIRDPDAFRRTFYQILDNAQIHSLYSKSLMLQLIETILEDHGWNTSVPETAQSTTAALVKAYLDANYHLECNLDQLAAQFSYSKFYLEKLFQKTYGTSIVRYRNQQRMVEAQNLLRNHSVTETAQLTGYSSIYTFSRAFRTFYGYSPTQNT